MRQGLSRLLDLGHAYATQMLPSCDFQAKTDCCMGSLTQLSKCAAADESIGKLERPVTLLLNVLMMHSKQSIDYLPNVAFAF